MSIIKTENWDLSDDELKAIYGLKSGYSYPRADMDDGLGSKYLEQEYNTDWLHYIFNEAQITDKIILSIIAKPAYTYGSNHYFASFTNSRLSDSSIQTIGRLVFNDNDDVVEYRRGTSSTVLVSVPYTKSKWQKIELELIAKSSGGYVKLSVGNQSNEYNGDTTSAYDDGVARLNIYQYYANVGPFILSVDDGILPYGPFGDFAVKRIKPSSTVSSTLTPTSGSISNSWQLLNDGDNQSGVFGSAGDKIDLELDDFDFNCDIEGISVNVLGGNKQNINPNNSIITKAKTTATVSQTNNNLSSIEHSFIYPLRTDPNGQLWTKQTISDLKLEFEVG
jgi:hypothetical protein